MTTPYAGPFLSSWSIYHRERNHQGLGNRLIENGDEVGVTTGQIEFRERLGGIIELLLPQGRLTVRLQSPRISCSLPAVSAPQVLAVAQTATYRSPEHADRPLPAALRPKTKRYFGEDLGFAAS